MLQMRIKTNIVHLSSDDSAAIWPLLAVGLDRLLRAEGEGLDTLKKGNQSQQARLETL